MKDKKSTFFWVSYSDLMTSLFFIMLTLYVLSIALMRYKQKATEEQLRKIKEIQNATRELPEEYFEYQERYKRFSLKQQIEFKKDSSIINHKYFDTLTAVGKSIEDLILKMKKTYSSDNIKYLIIIEGMASKDNSSKNFDLSYQRALALKNLWINRGVRLDPSICEIIIAGSGTEGVGRFDYKKNDKRDQRILIQIIPKIGKIEEL